MEGGATDAKFVEEWRPFVASIVRSIKVSLEIRSEVDDLIAFGFRGLLEARERFDPARGVHFKTFAYYRVRGAVFDGVRDMAYLPRRAYATRKAAMAADQLLEDQANALAAAPPGSKTTKEAAAAALEEALGKLAASFVLASVGQDAEDQSGSPEEELISATDAHIVRSAVDVLPERERALVEGFYFQGRRFDDVAADLGISKSWASRLHTRALTLLRRAIQEAA